MTLPQKLEITYEPETKEVSDPNFNKFCHESYIRDQLVGICCHSSEDEMRACITGKQQIKQEKVMKLNIGCGPHRIDGYTGVDLLPGPSVDIVAPADKLPFEDNSISEILAEHLIEHLTYFQFNRAMAEWYRVLKPGGILIIECPDLLGLCKQFVEANEYGRYTTYKGYWPIIAHFYGHQRGRNHDEEMSQVHKSGYTEEHLTNVLIGLGYEHIDSETPKKATPHSPVLRLRAVKCLR